MNISIFKFNKLYTTVNSVVEFLNLINESNHVYYIDNDTHINPDTFEKDVEAYQQYKDCIWVGNDCGYDHTHYFKNIDIKATGENEYAKYGVVTMSKVTMPPIDQFIFETYDDFVYYMMKYDVNETPNYEGIFDWFLEKHYKSIDLSNNVIFLIKEI